MLLLTIVIVILTSVIGYFVNLHLSRRPYHHIKSVPLPHALDYIPGYAADLKRRRGNDTSVTFTSMLAECFKIVNDRTLVCLYLSAALFGQPTSKKHLSCLVIIKNLKRPKQ